MGGICAKLYKYGVASDAGIQLDPTDALFRQLVHLLSVTLPRLPGVRSGYLNRCLNRHAPVRSAETPALVDLPATSSLPTRSARPARPTRAATTNIRAAPSTSETLHGCALTYPEQYEQILAPFAPDGLENCQYACLLRSRSDFSTLSPPDQLIGQYVRLETPSLYLKMKGRFFEAYRGSVEAGIARSVDEWAKDISNYYSNRRLRRANSVRLYRCYEALGWLDSRHYGG